VCPEKNHRIHRDDFGLVKQRPTEGTPPRLEPTYPGFLDFLVLCKLYNATTPRQGKDSVIEMCALGPLIGPNFPYLQATQNRPPPPRNPSSKQCQSRGFQASQLLQSLFSRAGQVLASKCLSCWSRTFASTRRCLPSGESPKLALKRIGPSGRVVVPHNFCLFRLHTV
jgi:hypothetical protein